MGNNEIVQLRKDLDKTNERIDNLVEALREAEVLSKGHWNMNESFRPYAFVTTREKIADDRTQLILNHLGLEFEWVECKPHYKLKEKEDK